MKDQGITLVSLVITIIVMLILATITILYGTGVPKEAGVVSVYNEIREIEGAMQEGFVLGKIKTINAGESLSIWNEVTITKETPSASDVTKMGLNTEHHFYRLDFTTSRALKNVLEIENVKNDYLLDWEDLNIYLIKGIDLLEEEGQPAVTTYNSDEIELYYKNVFSQ